jgi:ribosomal protein L11 methyltransferase
VTPRPRRAGPRGGRPGRTWAEVSVVTSTAAREAVAAMLWRLGGRGLAEVPLASGETRLRTYLAPSRLTPAALARLRRRVRGLRRYGLDPHPASVTARLRDAAAWQRASRRGLRPVRFGRLVVAPTRVRVPARAGRIVIRIDPGLAFGSGAHASTRLALRALLRRRDAFARGGSVLDIGTGSGILAIAAARLGARRVLARDIDPAAVAVARENARANGVARTVRVARGAGAGRGARGGRHRLILANLTAEAVAALAPEIARALDPQGAFIGSGITRERMPEVRAAAAAAGLEAVDVLRSGEWRAVVFVPALQSSSRRVQ